MAPKRASLHHAKKKEKAEPKKRQNVFADTWLGFIGMMAFFGAPTVMNFWMYSYKGTMNACIIMEANATDPSHRMTMGHSFYEMRHECVMLHTSPLDDFLDEPFMNQMQNGRPAAINVGPNSLTKEELAFLRRLRGDQPLVRMVFVEPNPEVYDNLQKNLDMYGIHNESYQIVKAALCPDNEPRPFFRFKPETGLSELGSNNITFPMRNSCGLLEDKFVLAQSYASRGLYKRLGKDEPKELEEIRNVTEPLIENFTVRCITPKDMLAEAGIKPEEVAYLKMDAEGYDTELLSLFLDIEDFAPAMIQWEFYVSHDSHLNRDALAEDMRAQIIRLADRHYRTYMKGSDFVAVQTEHIHEEL